MGGRVKVMVFENWVGSSGWGKRERTSVAVLDCCWDQGVV